MNATTIDIDTTFELIALEEMFALPAMEANADTFAFAYKY